MLMQPQFFVVRGRRLSWYRGQKLYATFDEAETAARRAHALGHEAMVGRLDTDGSTETIADFATDALGRTWTNITLAGCAFV